MRVLRAQGKGAIRRVINGQRHVPRAASAHRERAAHLERSAHFNGPRPPSNSSGMGAKGAFEAARESTHPVSALARLDAHAWRGKAERSEAERRSTDAPALTRQPAAPQLAAGCPGPVAVSTTVGGW